MNQIVKLHILNLEEYIEKISGYLLSEAIKSYLKLDQKEFGTHLFVRS